MFNKFVNISFGKEATPTSRQSAGVIGEMDEVEDTPHPS